MSLALEKFNLLKGAIRLTMTTKFTNINLQDTFLNQARKENATVGVHLVNGFQIKGTVKGFDNFTVIIDTAGKQQLIYKHAISTISPLKAFNKPLTDLMESPEGDK